MKLPAVHIDVRLNHVGSEGRSVGSYIYTPLFSGTGMVDAAGADGIGGHRLAVDDYPAVAVDDTVDGRTQARTGNTPFTLVQDLLYISCRVPTIATGKLALNLRQRVATTVNNGVVIAITRLSSSCCRRHEAEASDDGGCDSERAHGCGAFRKTDER